MARNQPPLTGGDPDDPLLEVALQDLAWYARARDMARRANRTTELAGLLAGAATVVAAGIAAPATVTATVAGAAVFIGGYRQVSNHNERYVLAAEAWSRLRLAIRRYELSERDEESRRRLHEEVEGTATAEMQDWAASRRGLRPGPAPGGQLP
ncbi:SLATT domain-containing protein [Streptomyces sp. NBC_01262]|uniref:SLATT domain-containing protein n=1 Tax=Streptomyces sp. NBC_01262 TaxID=2903803 RepID=UPI002E353D00|nr:SLATT domain-containing protein [Streptomyces sp. NBC_01262]